MAEYFYTYGDNAVQHVDEAQSAIVAALDLLIEEMRRYMEIYDPILASEETDEHQAFERRLRKRLSETAAKYFPDGEPLAWPESDPEIEKQRKRDSNTAEIGGMEKRLRRLLHLRNIFAETEPENTSRAQVHELYRVFKLQIMRHVMELSEEFSSRITLDPCASLSVYSATVRACGCLDESWGQCDVYPFTDAKF